MAARKSYRAPRRLYLSRDKERVVEEGDPEAGYLLAAEGAEVPQAEVDRYQLHDLPEPEGDAPASPGKEGREAGTATGKMVAAPPEDKAKAPPGAAQPPAAPAERRPSGGTTPPPKEPA